jgi:Domain of unknown function (DUF4349)/Putative zinc-finger
MTTATHPFTPEEVMAFVDGELSADRSQELAAHIDHCAECQEIVTAFRKTSAGLSPWAVPPVPTQLEVSVAAAATKNSTSLERLRSSTPWRLLPGSLRRSTFALVGTAALILLAIAISIPTRHPARDLGLYVSERGRQQQAEWGGHRIETEKRDSRSLTTLATPGVAKDSNGLFHGLGDHAENSFSVDGQPLSDQQSRVFTGPMIARAVSLSIVVKDFDAGRASLDAILARHNGYTAGLNVSTPPGAARTLQASLRIPAAHLAAALTELKALGRVEAETQNGEEVTQQHADLVARLKNSRETEQRLQDVLLTRTGKVKDVLEVEREIARVRGEIEQMESEQQTLEHRVDFAALDLKLAEEYKAQLNSPAPSVAMQLRNAIVDGFRSAFQSLLALVLFLAESGPTLVLWLLVLAIPARLLWRRYRRSLATGSIAGI